MPLIIMCGLPCSGKSLVAEQLNNYFSSTRKCLLIKDDNVSIGFQRNEVYADAQKEKELRSSLKSQVERYLSKDKVVILDSANYIKGYRYELYCISKGCKTTHCVVHCDLLSSDCWNFNESLPSPPYTRNTFDALVQRFETPEAKNRWDSPLFIRHMNEELSLHEIEGALFRREPPPPNQATQNQPLASTNFLYDLDQVTQEIVRAVLSSQRTCGPGDPIPVPRADQMVVLTRSVTAGDLARLRRQFISYTKCHPVSDDNRIPNMFVQYVNKSL